MPFYITVFQQEEGENAKSGSVVVQNTADLSSGVWRSHTNGTGPNFDTGKVDAVTLVSERENGDDDPWDNGGWEFKVAEAEESKHDLTNKVPASFHKNNPCIGRGYKLYLPCVFRNLTGGSSDLVSNPFLKSKQSTLFNQTLRKKHKRWKMDRFPFQAMEM